MNTLNGWQRLAIVLSALWLMVVGIECWVELVRGHFGTGWLTDTIIVKTGKPISTLNPYARFVPVDQVVNWQRFLLALIAPVILFGGAGLFVGLDSQWLSEVGWSGVRQRHNDGI